MPRSTATATAWPRCASSAAPRTSTASWRARLSGFLGIGGHASSTPPASTPTAALFETLLGEEDAVISDALNHA